MFGPFLHFRNPALEQVDRLAVHKLGSERRHLQCGVARSDALHERAALRVLRLDPQDRVCRLPRRRFPDALAHGAGERRFDFSIRDMAEERPEHEDGQEKGK